MMRALGIIPARGGSKGIPHKNIVPVCGVPLLTYTVRAALTAHRLTRTILTTDDADIARVGRESGVDVPFMRPAELAADDTPTLPVLFHALETLSAAGDTYDCVVLLQPTAPLRTSEDIDQSIALLEQSGADSVVSVSLIPGHYHPDWQLIEHDGRLTCYNGKPLSQLPPRRQQLSPTYSRNGALYVVWTHVLLEQRSLYGQTTAAYIMPEERSVNIDGERDLATARYYLEKRHDPA